MLAAVAPEETEDAADVLPVAVLSTSTTFVPPALDRPEYSSTLAPMSALAVVVTVMVGLVPAPAVIGALHTLSSVLSDALNEVSLVYVLPAESVTPEALALPALHTPASTMRRLPLEMLEVGCRARLAATPRLLTCCTKASVVGGAVTGVTALEAADCPLVPTALVALTLKV